MKVELFFFKWNFKERNQCLETGEGIYLHFVLSCEPFGVFILLKCFNPYISLLRPFPRLLTPDRMWPYALTGLALLLELCTYNLLFNSELLCYLDWSSCLLLALNPPSFFLLYYCWCYNLFFPPFSQVLTILQGLICVG